MKKNRKKNKQKAPAYAFGIGDATGISNLLGTILGGVSEEGSAGNIAGGAISGAALGAEAGLSIGGPIGAGIGGVVGLGASLFGGIRRKKQLQEQKRKKKMIQGAEIGMNNAAEMNQDYWSENPLAYTFENGGMLPDLAYLDNNEVIRDVNGNISKVPNTKPGTDNHLVDATNLESVLSDNIKDPITKKTFAKAGKQITRKYAESKGTDRFAENTNRLNKQNANLEYDNLLMRQESVKQAKNIKNKSKEIPAYKDGMFRLADATRAKNTETVLNSNILSDFGKAIWNFLTEKPTHPQNATNSAAAAAFSANEKSRAGLGNVRYHHDTGNTNHPTAPYWDYNTIATFPVMATDDVSPITLGTIPKPTVSNIPTETTLVPANNNPVSKSTARSNPQPIPQTIDRQDPGPLLSAPAIPQLPIPSINRDVSIRRVNPTVDPKDSSNTDNTDTNWLALAPVAYNFMQGLRNPEVEDAVINPYTPAINSSMARRRLNVEPVLAANRRSRAISNYNLANTNSNSGINLAARTQAAVGEYAANADVYANRDNVNNQYLAERANMMNNLGQQYIQNRVLTNDMNARNRAAARNYTSSAISQLGKYAQTKELMDNAYNRDTMMLPFLSNLLSQGYTEDLVNQALSTTKRNRRK